MEAKPIVKAENILGEGPMWHSIHQMLYWVDIENKTLHGLEPHTRRHREWQLSKRAGTVVPATNGKLVLGVQGAIAELDATTGETTTLADLESHLPDNRCNDGKCDPSGRFWVGTMHLDCKPGTGSLYCIEKNLRIHRTLTGLTIANGMGWSPEGDYMYFIDSAEYHVKRFKFDKDKISLRNEEVILRFEEKHGMPDGMCVDNAGTLWIGFWGGHRIGRYDPVSGKHLLDINVPAPNVTSCCFGDQDLKTLYITTARDGLNAQQLNDFPLSGSLFSARVGVTGCDAHFFGDP